jgi:AraC-like DNA-binding protein
MQTATTYALDTTWRPLLKDLGIAPGNVLRRAGLPEDLFARPAIRLEAGDFHRFWSGFEAELDDTLFPLRLCQSIRSETFSPPLFAALCSPNFLVATQRIARYKSLVAPMRLSVQERGPQVTLRLAWLDEVPRPPRSLVVTELLFFVTLARLGTREDIHPRSVRTPEPPREAQAYQDFLGIPIVRGPQHEIVFDRADALRPFLTSNDSLWAAFEPELRTRLAELHASVTVGQRVRAALLEALPGGMAAMETVARKLAMSRRTLQRHLEAEGLTYTRLLQQTRHALARHYLENTTFPAAEIAFLIGFEEPNSFYRAFRDWTGQTPESLRRQTRLLPQTPGEPATHPALTDTPQAGHRP